jgi:hypothetical protein
MQSHNQFTFDPIDNIATDSVFTVVTNNFSGAPPPVPDNFLLLDGTNFLLLDGTNFLLL